MSQLSSQAERQFKLPLPFHSLQAPRRLDDAPTQWGEPSALLSLPTHVFLLEIPSRACMLGRFSYVQLFVTLWTIAH